MQPLEIDSAVFCDGARYTIISRENSSILTCPVASGAGGYTLNRVEGRDIDLELDRLTGHAACIAVDVPTWCRIAGDPLDAVADALADLLCETPTRFELERLAAASPVLTANTPGIPVFPAGIAPAANSYTLAGCCRSALVRGLSSPELYRTALTAAGATISRARRIAADNPDAIGSGAAVLTATIGLGGVDTAEIGVSCADMPEDGSLLIEGGRLADRGRRWRTRVLRLRGYRRGPEEPPARGPGRGRRGQAARRRGARRIVRHAVAQHGRPLPGGATCRRGARALPLARRPRDAGPRRQEGRWLERAGRGGRPRPLALGAGLHGRRFPFGNMRSHCGPASLSSGQYPHCRRLLRAGPPKEFRHGTHRPRI